MAASASTSARAKTRSQSGISVPRKVEAVATEPEGKKRATKKKSTTKANTSKPRAKVTTGRVAKKPAAKKTPTKSNKALSQKIEDKVHGIFRDSKSTQMTGQNRIAQEKRIKQPHLSAKSLLALYSYN